MHLAIDFEGELAEIRARGVSLEPFASSLGVPAETLLALDAMVLDRTDLDRLRIGFGKGPRPDVALGWPERDAQGIVSTIGARGENGEKGSAKGGTRGLIIPTVGSIDGGPIFVPEGLSDTATLLALGLAAIGRPNNATGAELLASMLRGREVVLLGENDCKSNGTWPGKTGVERVAAQLRRAGVGSVRIAFPPDDAKDVRAWWLAQSEATDSATNPATRSAIGRELAEKLIRAAGPSAESADRPRKLSEIQPRAIDWLWPKVIARGFTTLISGRNGSHKSTLLAYCSARLTRGECFPNGPAFEPRTVLFVAGEDKEAETLRNRIEAAGASLDLVVLPPRDLVRGGDSASILTWAEQPGRVPRNSVVIFDPISSFVPAGFKDNETASVRALIGTIEAFAERNDWAVVMIRHPNKSTEGPARLRVSGSGAWVDTPRLTWLVAADRDSESRRFLLPLKLNVASDREGFTFDVELKDVPGFESQPVVVDVRAGATVTADEVLSANDATDEERSEFDRACDWLDGALLPGESKSSKELRNAARTESIAGKTLNRAAKSLGIKMRGERPDVRGPWFWRRPPSRSGPLASSVPDGTSNLADRPIDAEFGVQSVHDNEINPNPERIERGIRDVLGNSNDSSVRPGQATEPHPDADDDDRIDFGGES